MSGWIAALMNATEGNFTLRLPSLCLAAVALDDAEVTVEALMSGTSILVAEAVALRDAIDGLMQVVLDRGRRIPSGWPDVPIESALVIVRECKRQSGWRQEAADTGRPAVVLVGGIEDVYPPQALATADRTVTLRRGFFPEHLEAAIRLVTGGHVELEDHWPPVTYEDAVACIAKGSTAIECASRLYKLISRQDDQTGDDVTDNLPRYGEPAPLGQVASGVVRRLSEMSGFGEAGQWGVQAAADIRAYAEGKLAWSEVDRGVLVSGPPGSGKTTFARAFALECGPSVDFAVTTYTDWSAAGGSSGDSMSKGLNKLFEGWRARASKKPLILFVDEIDTMGSRGGNDHNESWYTAIINAWLAFLDGAVPRTGIVVVAATNHPERVDAALKRAGRRARHVELPMPGIEALQGIIRHHLGPEAVIDEAELARAARFCRGMSPAEVEQASRDARRAARLTHGRRVTPGDLCAVLAARRLAALQLPGAAEHDRRIAIHEAGHAVAALEFGGLVYVDVDASHAMTVYPTLDTRDGIERRMTMLLSGMAAEAILLGEHTCGNAIDLREATQLAASAHASWGMGATLRAHAFDTVLGDAIDQAVETILRDAHARALALVEGSREAVLRLAGRLQEDRYLDAAEVRAIVDDLRSAPDRTRYGDRVARTVGRKGTHPGP